MNKKICIINHIFDSQRTNKENVIKTHDGTEHTAISTNSLMKLADSVELRESDVIVIDESQFFDDLYLFISYQLEHYNSKNYYVIGLSGNYKQEPYPEINKIIGIADSIVHLKAFCEICKDGTEAPFTISHGNGNFNYKISYTDYTSVCRKHLKK